MHNIDPIVALKAAMHGTDAQSGQDQKQFALSSGLQSDRYVAQEHDMIARIWRGEASASSANAYYRHFTTNVVPHLKKIPGHKGSYLLRKEAKGQVEFLAVTLWESMETIKAFAGPDPNVAVVEPEAQAALTAFNDFARHYEVAYSDA